MHRLRTLLLAPLLLAPAPALAQGAPATLTLVVRDSATGEPIANASVQVAGVAQAGRTNRAGTSRLGRIPSGNRIVEVSRIGYARGRVAIDFTPGAAVEQTITLSSDPVEVEEVSARAGRRSAALEARGFYDRQRRGQGTYVTHETIERLRPMRTVEIFYHVRGFTVKRDRMGQPYLSSSRGGTNFSAECAAPLIFVDGTLMSGANRFSMRGAGPLETINPESIAAIEAYAGPASVPEEFRLPGASCGVVVIWTRAGDEG